MKILFVASGMRFGGAERVMSVLANEWHRMGIEVRFFLTDTPPVSAYPLDKEIEIVSSFEAAQKSRLQQPVSVREIRKECIRWKPDAVISFYNDVCALTAIAIMGLHIPLIYSERNDPSKVNQRFADKIYRRIVEQKADAFVFQTEGAKCLYPERVQKKGTVIINPMDTSEFPYHNYENEELCIVSVGRLEPQKNQAVLIEAFSRIEKSFPDYSLVIYGEGSLREQLNNLILEKDLQNRVLLPGVKPTVQKYIQNASLFVLSSDYEGIPNALIEAMAIGLPCVSTDCSPGGERKLITSEENGLLVPCGDVEQLADAMERMLRDRGLAEKCGNNARKIREQVDVTTIANSWLDFVNSRGTN